MAAKSVGVWGCGSMLSSAVKLGAATMVALEMSADVLLCCIMVEFLMSISWCGQMMKGEEEICVM